MRGKVISHYQILEEIGRGGMGLVYKALDTKLNRFVALKFLPQELTQDAEIKTRFIREAQAASALDHPNICTVHEINETDDGRMYICMAYYEAETLKQIIKNAPLSIDEAINISLQICQGLSKAHKQGLIHRDIKPANILITKDGLVKIIDFGLARLEGQTRLTRDSTSMGTVAYISPEQAQGNEVDQRTDIWSLGVILYEMCTNKLPFDEEYDAARLEAVGIYLSSDGGQTWAPGYVGLEPNGSLHDIVFDPVNPQILYTSDIYSGVYRSVDGGNTWERINKGLRTRAALSLSISSDGQHLYTVTDGEGVFRLDMSEFPVGVEQTHSQPVSFHLNQNYPNPFNPTTIIDYQLSISGEVELNVYNLLGQKRITLVSEKQVAGTYQIEWNATGYPSGVYLMELAVDGQYKQVKRLVLCK